MTGLFYVIQKGKWIIKLQLDWHIMSLLTFQIKFQSGYNILYSYKINSIGIWFMTYTAFRNMIYYSTVKLARDRETE